MKYTVSMRVDARVDVIVDAESFEEAFKKARDKTFEWENCSLVGYNPVNAMDENGSTEDYNG